MTVLLETVAASVAFHWQRRQPRLLHVSVSSVLGLAVPVASARKLRHALDQELDRLEVGCRNRSTPAVATLRCWPASAGAMLDLGFEGSVRRRWHFPPAPLSGAAWRARRGRRALPAQPMAHTPTARICLLSPNPALAGWAQAAALGLDLGGVVTVATVRQAYGWLATHPTGRLLLLDGSSGLWCIDLSGTYAPERLARPDVAGLTTLMRKIFHHIPELPAESDKIAA